MLDQAPFTLMSNDQQWKSLVAVTERCASVEVGVGRDEPVNAVGFGGAGDTATAYLEFIEALHA